MELGLAVGLDVFAPVKVVEGVQVYVFAPLTVKVTEPPLHMVYDCGEGITFNVGRGFTVIVAVCEPWHPVEEVPITL